MALAARHCSMVIVLTLKANFLIDFYHFVCDFPVVIGRVMGTQPDLPQPGCQELGSWLIPTIAELCH